MNYPNGLKKNTNNEIYYGNRGMSLEEDLNVTNKYYLENDIAVIYKKPTPITINHVDYPNRRDAVITDAKFKIPSTTDYNGIYKGKYIDFEAKETKNKTSFPISNIHIHQIEHLKKITKLGGIGFIIVRFTSLDETYYLSSDELISFIESKERKSIPIEYFRKYGYLIKHKLRPLVDYLEYVDKYIEGVKWYYDEKIN